MAAPSPLSVNNSCFYCKNISALLRPGWRLRYGGSAMLCDRCASAYEEGRFCDIFHLELEGWRDCVTCKKNVHCGCIMSTHTHTVLDAGGVMCTKCLRNDNRAGCKCSKMPFINSSPCPWRDLQEPQEVASDKLITVSTPGAPSEKDAPLSQSREQFSADTLGGADTPGSSINNEQPRSYAPRKIHSYRRYTPMTSEEELQQIQKDANSVVVPLFEKTLTVSDADPKNGRVVVPKRCAKDYFPKVSEPQGFPIKIQDTNGNDWDFRFRYWPNNNSTMYVLEGLKEYMISKKCQAGDKVAFYRIDPEGKLVIGLKKTQPNVTCRKKQLRTLENKAKLTSGIILSLKGVTGSQLPWKSKECTVHNWKWLLCMYCCKWLYCLNRDFDEQIDIG